MEQEGTTRFEAIINDEGAVKLAEHIIEIFGEGEGKCLDYDFTVRVNKGEVDSTGNHMNLVFKFDTEYGTIARNIRDVLADETIEATEARKERFSQFLAKVGEMLTGPFSELFKERIRKEVFGEVANAANCPMENMEFIAFDIMDLPDDACVVKIDKAYPADPDFVPPRPVSDEIFSIAAETGETLEEIIDRKKAEGDEAYAFITGVSRVKHFYEAQLNMFVDFYFDPKASVDER